jgi:glycosyltransferase involved in cell wall biosynthesis
MKLTFCYRHIAPYHHARLAAVQRHGDITVINYGDVSKVAFEEFNGTKSYPVINLHGSNNNRETLHNALDESMPDVLILPGWGYPYTLKALSWALKKSIPSVVISDSQEMDKKRTAWKETIKSRIASLFSSGLVAGIRSREYLNKLGMPEESIFTGCDVVDNNHFILGADNARTNAARLREVLQLPEKYFLAVNRFIPEKNLFRLVQAYHAYKRAGSPGKWNLVMLGDGNLRSAIRQMCFDLGIEKDVLLLGAMQYAELPNYYGLAGAFILASICEPWGLVVNEAMAAGLPILVSHHCGCAHDLVEEGINGYTFDPFDVNELSRYMVEIAGGKHDLSSMGRASREIISRWTPEVCAENLWKAARLAYERPHPKPSVVDQFILLAASRKLTSIE